MNNQKTGRRTLLWSVIMSAPGPLILGFGLIIGRSITQIADFVRRSAELIAIITAFVIYKITTKNGECDETRKKELEKISNIIVGIMMCLGGGIMLALAFMSDNEDAGNVIPSLVVALLGLIANTIFAIKYIKLNREEPNAILAVQARLYRAKMFVDACVTFALLTVIIAPGTEFSHFSDIIGSAVVSVYLIFCGIQTIFERLLKKSKK